MGQRRSVLPTAGSGKMSRTHHCNCHLGILDNDHAGHRRCWMIVGYRAMVKLKLMKCRCRAHTNDHCMPPRSRGGYACEWRVGAGLGAGRVEQRAARLIFRKLPLAHASIKSDAMSVTSRWQFNIIRPSPFISAVAFCLWVNTDEFTPRPCFFVCFTSACRQVYAGMVFVALNFLTPVIPQKICTDSGRT